MLTLDTRCRELQFSKDEQSLATGANTREVFRSRFLRTLASKPAFALGPTLTTDESVLDRMIAKYSEQLTYQPLNEVRFWFEYSGGLFLDRGYPALFYAAKSGAGLSPNKSAIAAIGEGLAGLLAQRLYRCRRLARPNHDYPDIVMEANKRTFLVESKATIGTSESGMLTTMNEELPRFVSFVASCAQLDTRPVAGLFVGTLVIDPTYYCSFLSLVEMA